LYAALTACLGDIQAEIIGKPSARLFDKACQTLRLDRESVIMIGDNPITDIAGANAFGIASILIGANSEIDFEDLLTK
jgi:4-nitrophenyl phosphatase